MRTEWSIRAGVLLENVMDTLQQFEEIEGLSDSEYIKAMFYLSNRCSENAMKCLGKMIKEGKLNEE